jgi:hypothetical protein
VSVAAMDISNHVQTLLSTPYQKDLYISTLG